MKKLILITAALAFTAVPAMAANMSAGGVLPASFGPNETRSLFHSTPYPHSGYVAGDMDADSGHLHEHDLAPATQGHFALGDMDSDSGPGANS